MSPEMFEAKAVKEEAIDEANDPSIPMRGVTVNFLATRQIIGGASGTSSPSREVADILGGEEGTKKSVERKFLIFTLFIFHSRTWH